MRVILSKKAKRVLIIAFSLAGAVIVLTNVIGYCTGNAYLSVFAMQGEDKHEIRSRLLEEAMRDVGACTPDKAADIWAGGLKKRSGAMQYAAMTNKLREIYAAELDKSFPNWVTGMSSPWVESYSVTKAKTLGETRIYDVLFHTATSTGPAGDHKATIHITREDGYWRIGMIQTDDALTPYTGAPSELSAD